MKRQTLNPYLPAWEYIPDGEPKLFGDRVYIYGSHDVADGYRYCLEDYVCWSAPKDDLASWTFEGVIYKVTDDPDYAERNPKEVLYFAPDCTVGPDGRYYLYYFSSEIDKIGVAVCDKPAGHYKFYGNIRFEDGRTLTMKDGFGMIFDPGILSDESGNWLYYGYGLKYPSKRFPIQGTQGGYVVELEDDMLTIKTNPKHIIPGRLTEGIDDTSFKTNGFQEASSIRHYGDLYYLVFSGEDGHDLSYATSKYPDRDFQYRGTIVSNGDVGIDGRDEENAVNYLGNNHGGLLRIDDKDYIFYHRHTHGKQFSRQGCIEPVVINEDGSIKQVEITSQGASGKPLIAKGIEYSAHHACYLRSKNGILHYSSSVVWNDEHPFICQENNDGVASVQNQFIYNMKDGATCGFKYLSFSGCEKSLSLSLRGNFKGKVELVLDDPNSKAIETIDVETINRWSVFSATINPIEGTHAVYFKVVGEGSCDFDSFEFN